MHTNIWLWILFNAGVLCALAIDLFAVQKRAHIRSAKEAAVWTAVWLLVILCFIGIKIVLTDICPIPTAVSLGIVGLILLSAIGLSLLLRPRGRSAAKPTPNSHDHAQPAANTR